MRLWPCLAALLAVQASVLARANLLPSSSFEQGATGWALWHAKPDASSGGVTDEAARAGGHCFKVANPGSGGANLHSDPVPATGNADYSLSVYARTKGARGVRVALWALDAEGKTIRHAIGHPAALPADQPAWAHFKTIVRTPPNCAALKAHLICDGGAVWWDAAKIEPGRDASPYSEGPPFGAAGKRPKNLLSNSGFEADDAGWSLWHQFPGRSSGGAAPKIGRGGGKAFHVRNPGKGGANLHADPVPCKPNTTYTLSVYARVKDGVGVRLAGWTQDAAMQVNNYAVDGALDLPANVPELTRFPKTFTTPADAAFLKAHLMCGGGEAWWDDCQLEEAPKATAYVPGPAGRQLPRRVSPKAAAYARAIIEEGRLRDLLAQATRLAAHSRARGMSWAARPEHVARARQAVERVSERLGARYLVPDYLGIDYEALTADIRSAQEELSDIWQRYKRNLATLFEPWRPKMPQNLDKKQFANEFFIFPCFTRGHFFQGRGNWDILEPFGFRIVSGWWGAGFSPDGRLRAEAIDNVVRQCGEHGYRVDTSFGVAHAVRAALWQKLGDAIYTRTASGEWSPQGNCHDTLNIWHPEVRRVAADYLRKFAAHFADNPGVASHELINEPSLTIEKRVHGYDHKPLGVAGYSPEARRAWTAWLTERYGTIGRLNAAWRARFKAFADVQPPADLTPPAPKDGRTPVPVAPVRDFQLFRAESHADWFRHCVAAMHAGDPRKPVISQLWSPAVDRKDSGLDLRLMAENVPWDIVGTHDWPGRKPGVLCLYAVSMNRKAGRPMWEDELIWSHWERKGTPEPVMRAALERNLWRQIAWGKRGISLFNLDSEWAHDKPHNWNNSMLNIEADLEIPRYSTGIIPTIERKVYQFKDILFATRLLATDVAILRPTTAALVSAPDHATRREASFIASALLERHFLPLLIPEEHIIGGTEDLAPVDLLIVPWAINVPTALQEKLLAWVQRGGTLLATGPFGLFDETGKPTATLLRRTLGDAAWTYDAKSEKWAVDASAARPGVERRSVGKAKVRLLVAAHGKGRVCLCPERLSPSRRVDVLTEIVAETIAVPFVRTDLRDLEIIPREGRGGARYLFVVNLDPTARRDGPLLVRGEFPTIVDLTCDVRLRVPVDHKGGTTRIPVRLHPGGGLFLDLGR